MKYIDRPAVYRKILEHLVLLELTYRKAAASAKPGIYTKPPTTDQIAKHLRCSQREAISFLNELQTLGAISKSRRLSEGPTGHGYDGSLFSEVHPTEKTIQRYGKPKA